ncbi:MAG: hypothetical protein OXE50_14920 [Chloroflexi bacterium]|nr:hypothetical protein [Chloroflexota bacterium]
MTDTIDTIGYFWLADNPDNKVAGRLLFYPKQARLDILESLESIQPGNIPVGTISEDKVRIEGKTQMGDLILADCQRQVFFSECYRVGSIIRGISSESSTQNPLLSFDYMDIELDLLSDWVGSIDTTITTETNQGFSVNYQPHVLAEHQFDWGEVSLLIHYMIHYLSSQPVTSHHRLIVKLNEPRGLNDLRKLKSAAQRLLTLATNRPCLIEEAKVGIGRGEGTWMEHTLGDNLVDTDRARSPLPLFSYTDIGGIEGIAKWFDLYLMYGRAINSLTSSVYIDVLYAENRYTNSVAAIESIAVRDDSSLISDHSVKRRVKHIANQLAGTIFDDLVDNQIETWANKAVDIRNEWAAHGSDNDRIDYQMVSAFGESVYYLGVIWLLTECGMPQSVFDKIQERGVFDSLKRRLRPHLENG